MPEGRHDRARDLCKLPAAERAADVHTEPPGLPARIGPYRVVRLLGDGGMGRVYEAEQENPRRPVALKVVRPGVASPELLRRFVREAQVLGRLQHPGIAQVYEADVGDDGQPFFVMEFVRGLPLDQYARGHRLDVPARLELLARVCDAVQHAHDKGVIHRDLKPANVLVDQSGRPKVLDFGVAHVTGADVQTLGGQTEVGQLIGTVGYMSPEQFAADPARLDPRTDVYALGVVLFELLAERPPYDLHDLPLAEAARVVNEREPSRLGSVNSRLRGDVETIVATALAKEKERRYASAAALAADLRRFLNHEPITARPPSLPYRLAKFARRNKALVGGTLGVMLALVLGMVAATVFAVGESAQRRRADEEARVSLRLAYRGSLAAALASLADRDVAEAARYLDRAPPSLRGWEWRHLHGRLDDSLAAVPGLATRADWVAFCPPGGRVASVGLRRLTLLDAQTGRPLEVLREGLYGHVRVESAGQGALAVISQDGDSTWAEGVPLPPGDGRQRWLTTPGRGFDAAALSPAGNRLALANYEADADRPTFAVYDLPAVKRPVVCRGHTDVIHDLAFSADGRRLASASEDRTARVWDAATGAVTAVLRGHTGNVRAVTFSPDGARVLTGSDDGTVRQWDAASGRELAVRRGHTDNVRAVAWSPDGRRLASGGLDNTVRLWDADGGDGAVLLGHTGAITRLAFTPDGARLASAAADGTARLWDLVPRAEACTLRGHTSYVYPVAFSPDGLWLASGGWDRAVRLWDAATGEECAALRHPDFVFALAWAPDGTWLASGDHAGTVRLWDAATARVRRSWRADPGAVHGLAVAPDGGTLAVAGNDDGVGLWDPATGARVGRLATGTATTRALAYSPDAQLLATADDDGLIRLWDPARAAVVACGTGHDGPVQSVAFSPDGGRLVSASLDRTVRLWDAASGAQLAVFRGHTDEVFGAVFHPDGSRVASGGRDRAVRLWDPATGEEVVRLQGHTNYIWSLEFSADGTALATGSGDTTVQLWDAAPLAPRLAARREAATLRPEAEANAARLLERLGDPARVVRALRDDGSLSEPARRAALRAVLRLASEQPGGD